MLRIANAFILAVAFVLPFSPDEVFSRQDPVSGSTTLTALSLSKGSSLDIRSTALTGSLTPDFMRLLPHKADPPRAETGQDQNKPAPLSDTEIKSLVEKYVKSENDGEKQEVLAKLKEHDAIPKDKVKAYTDIIYKLVRDGPKHSGKSPSAPTDPKYSKAQVFSAGTEGGGKKKPLFVVLHSGGPGQANVIQARGLFPTYAKAVKSAGGILVLPVSMFEEDVSWNKKGQDKFVVSLIDEMKRTYDIDTNRVFLTGPSMGGWGTWFSAVRRADLFAAISPVASGVSYKAEPLKNLFNTAVYVIHGSKDNNPSKDDPDVGPVHAIAKLKEYQQQYGGFKHEYKEYPGGHMESARELTGAITWLAPHKREPYPKKIVWQIAYDGVPDPYFYWLKLKTSNDNREVVAEIRGNEIKIEGNGVESIFLNDKLVNLNQDITVTVGAEQKFSGKVQPSITALLETLAAKKDLEMYGWARIDIK